MGKHNKGKGHDNRPRDPFTNVKTMGREGMRIMKDIAFGRYNIYNEGHIFRSPDLVKATITEVDKKLLDLSIHINAIQYAYANSTDEAVRNLLWRDQRSYEAYSLIKDTLYRILLSGDTGFLLVLQNKLPAYKYNI